MSKTYKTFKKEKRLYFAIAVAAYFLPFIITTACLLPFVKAAQGFKIAAGLGIVIVNAIPFLMGIFRSFFAHFPMFNLLAVAFLMLGGFFIMDTFRSCAETLLWIELAAALGSIASCVFWALHKKYARYAESVKATVASGAFSLKEEKND